jgi:hypothetical protein
MADNSQFSIVTRVLPKRLRPSPRFSLARCQIGLVGVKYSLSSATDLPPLQGGDYSQPGIVVSERVVIAGNPDQAQISIRRFTRLTDAFSKKVKTEKLKRDRSANTYTGVPQGCC